MGRSLGEGMRGFKDSISGESNHTAVQPVTQQPAAIVQQPQPVALTADIQRVPVAEPVREEIPAA
jgi:Sec-independent protein translocase protein TatA